MDTRELQGLSFRCLEDCGFCCTFTPEVAHDELARLRRQFPKLPIVREGGRLHLAFQGGCGACTLLSRRQCTAYADRPAHCRYFPFHVYFGRRTEVYVNRTCRGVEPLAGGDLAHAFQEQVLDVARPHQLAEHEREARRVHAQFGRNAKEASVWGDLDEAIRDALQLAEPVTEEAWRDALAPFAEEDVVARPFYLAPDLRWLTFEAAAGGLQPLEMQEDGSLRPAGAPLALEPRQAPPAAAAILARLAGRDLFAGQVASIVDEADYATTVAEAAALRVRQVRADLAVRAAILEQLGTPADKLASELDRFYDSAFLDAPTIGGWL